MSEPLRRFAQGAGLGATGGAILLAGVLAGWKGPVGPPGGPLLFPVPEALARGPSGRFDEARGDRDHEAVDLPARRGAVVVAVADGVILRMGDGKLSGLSIDLLAADGSHCFFYAHLDGYAGGVQEGARVARGATLGFVGTSGNAPEDAPHLHFAARRLEPGETCWEGEPVDPAPLIGADG